MDWNIVVTRNEGAKGGKGKEQENGRRRGVLGYLGRSGSAALGTMATEIYEHLSIDLQTHWCNRVSQVINEHADKACAGSHFLLQHISICISSHTYVIYMGWSSHIMHVSWINKGKHTTNNLLKHVCGMGKLPSACESELNSKTLKCNLPNERYIVILLQCSLRPVLSFTFHCE